MSRLKKQKMKARIKREVNKLVTAGVPKPPSKELVRMAKLYSVSLDKYHAGTNVNKRYHT